MTGVEASATVLEVQAVTREAGNTVRVRASQVRLKGWGNVVACEYLTAQHMAPQVGALVEVQVDDRAGVA